jgi:hypothetical protein
MTVEEKRSAMDQLFQSRVLRRCEQLKKMLGFICEAEIEGRAAELNEYLIGIEVFGRPTAYNPAEDSIVRTQAYELRNKLTRFYATEAPDAAIRIEIERGAYVPRFIQNRDRRATSGPATAPPDRPPFPATQTVPPQPASQTWMRSALIVSCCISVVLAAIVLLNWPRRTEVPQAGVWTPEMEAFWKPFLADDTPLMLAYESRLFINVPAIQLSVRDYRTNELSEVPNSPSLARLQKLVGSHEFGENRNYVDFGSINSVFLVMRTVGRHQNRIVLKNSQNVDWSDIFNNNVIFIGQASNQPRLRRIFEGGDFVETVGAVVNVHPKPGEQRLYPVEHPGKNDGDKYALLSRYPGPQPGHYIVTVGAAHSELPWAITEYVTNPRSVHELVEHLRQPSGQIPEAFQLVLRVTEQSQVPVRIRYVTHHVVAAPEYADKPAESKK